MTMEEARHKITGIILAGGKSRRMGRDKSLILLDGKPLLAHVISALETVCDSLILVSNDKRLDGFGIARFPDRIPDVGPLAGLYTGLFHSTTEYNLVLGCDTPLVNKALLEVLLKEAVTSFEAVQLATPGSTMPLLGLYRKSCTDKILGLIQSGERRLQESVASLKSKTVMLDKTLQPYALNINRPDDLKKAREMINAHKT